MAPITASTTRAAPVHVADDARTAWTDLEDSGLYLQARYTALLMQNFGRLDTGFFEAARWASP